MKNYVGYIVASKEDKQNLLSMGINLGLYNENNRAFTGCTVSEEALKKLTPFWGKYYWGLVSK